MTGTHRTLAQRKKSQNYNLSITQNGENPNLENKTITKR